MFTVRRRQGEHFFVNTQIAALVLELGPRRAMLGVYLANGAEPDNGPVALATAIQPFGRKHGFFLYPTGGPCTFVMTCEKGKPIRLNHADVLEVLEISKSEVQLGVGGPVPQSKSQLTYIGYSTIPGLTGTLTDACPRNATEYCRPPTIQYHIERTIDCNIVRRGRH